MRKKRRHIAAEQLSFDEVLQSFPIKKKWAEAVLARLRRAAKLPSQPRILDIGAGSGSFVAACVQLGYHCEGVEPCEEARLTSAQLSEHLGVAIPIRFGSAEAIPYDSEIFDVVHASSVIEHVLDLEASFAEIYRVLKPGGVFWFNAASSMCPRQHEIRGFPFFGWYPDSLKRKIMNWVKDSKPHLVGYTKTPAINWFTLKKARTLLERHGFDRVYDRWDLRGEDEGGRMYAILLRIIRSGPLTKFLADIAVPGCSYAAIKRLSSGTGA